MPEWPSPALSGPIIVHRAPFPFIEEDALVALLIAQADVSISEGACVGSAKFSFRETEALGKCGNLVVSDQDRTTTVAAVATACTLEAKPVFVPALTNHVSYSLQQRNSLPFPPYHSFRVGASGVPVERYSL
jgi:hypothetical protein